MVMSASIPIARSMTCFDLVRTLGACAALFTAGCQNPEIGRTSLQILPPQPSPNLTRQQDAKPAESDLRIVYVPPRAKKPLQEPLFPVSVRTSTARREV